MYDFANPGYIAVILTAVFNAYFIGIVAAKSGSGHAMLLWMSIPPEKLKFQLVYLIQERD